MMHIIRHTDKDKKLHRVWCTCRPSITLHNKVSLAVTLSLMHLPKSHDHSVQGLQKEDPPAVAATCFATLSATPAVAPTSSLRMTERLGGSAPAVCACSEKELAVSVLARCRPSAHAFQDNIRETGNNELTCCCAS